MPIYAYRCEACGHAKDVLQKFSDPLLTTCPSCGAEAFKKQVTAAGFQLKGSGWYVTDFRGDSKGAGGKTDAAADDSGKADAAKTEAAAPDKGKAETAKGDSATAAVAPAPAPANAPAPSSGSGPAPGAQ